MIGPDSGEVHPPVEAESFLSALMINMKHSRRKSRLGSETVVEIARIGLPVCTVPLKLEKARMVAHVIPYFESKLSWEVTELLGQDSSRTGTILGIGFNYMHETRRVM